MTETAAPRPRWYSIQEAAEYLDIGEPTLYRWMREGSITYRKVGDSTRFLEEDLDAAVQVHWSKHHSEKARQVCRVCGHDELVEGKLQSTGALYFHPKKTRFWTLRESGLQVAGMMCRRCGALALFGPSDELQALVKEERENKAKQEPKPAKA